MNLLKELIGDNNFHRKNELSIAEGIEEVNGVERILASLSEVQQSKPATEAISCMSYWNPVCGTFTYHTHTIVDSFRPDTLEQIAYLFFNAYSLKKQDWYSQFVCGENKPLPENMHVQDNEIRRDYQIGQGYFDFGVATLRHYHTLIALRHSRQNSVSIVLRSIDHSFREDRKSKKVFLLAPTGDYFSLENGQLHWHHICTVTGISLLPGVSDKYLMNVLRYLKLDTKERKTYTDEANSFIRFASQI